MIASVDVVSAHFMSTDRNATFVDSIQHDFPVTAEAYPVDDGGAGSERRRPRLARAKRADRHALQWSAPPMTEGRPFRPGRLPCRGGLKSGLVLADSPKSVPASTADGTADSAVDDVCRRGLAGQHRVSALAVVP